jgi:hypothetical protein
MHHQNMVGKELELRTMIIGVGLAVLADMLIVQE